MLATLSSLVCFTSLASARLLPRAGAAAASGLVFDGRVAATAKAADFDGQTGPFGSEFVKGQNLSFSELVLFPQVNASLFDAQVDAKAIEVTINDNSIFVPGDAASAQTAVRRTELNPRDDLVADNVTTTGVQALHFSIMPSATNPLNTSHEYSLVFLERADFAANIFMLRTGTLLGSNGSTANDLVLQGNTADGTQTLFSTPFSPGEFTNFALLMDFDANTIQVFASTGSDALKQQTQALPNDMSGNGQFHFGVNKNPVNPGQDVLRTGTQETDILEGVIYGGIFVEDGQVISFL
jgi:hypothetical protein